MYAKKNLRYEYIISDVAVPSNLPSPRTQAREQCARVRGIEGLGFPVRLEARLPKHSSPRARPGDVTALGAATHPRAMPCTRLHTVSGGAIQQAKLFLAWATKYACES